MDQDLGMLDKALQLVQHWPDAFCMLGGTLFGFLFTLAYERWFLAIAADPAQRRRQQGLTFGMCWLIGAATSDLLWKAWDPSDPWMTRAITSVVVSLLLSFAYPIAGAYATSKFPMLGSAWAKS